jgi:hypothetical protein
MRTGEDATTIAVPRLRSLTIVDRGCDTTEDSKQNRQKDGHKAQSREIALKASQIATNPSQ